MVNLQGCNSSLSPNQAIHLLANHITAAPTLPKVEITQVIAYHPNHPLIIANQALRKLVESQPPNRHPPKCPVLAKTQQSATGKGLNNVLQITGTQNMMENLITTTTPSESALLFHQVL